MPLSKDKKKAMMKLRDEFIKDNKLSEETPMGFLDEKDSIGKISRLPTGLIGFDILTNGGWIKGKINQLVGGESVGKTTMLLNGIGHWQKTIEDFLTVYIPAEKNFDREWATAQGCTEDMTWVYEPQTAEQNLDYVMKCCSEESPVNCLVIDTLQALSSAKEVYKGKKNDGRPADKERSVFDDSMALLPRLYSQFLRMYTSKMANELTLILTSQVRTDLNPMANGANRETGGNALKHYNMLNVKATRLGDSAWKCGDIPPNSYVVKLQITKSKVKNRYRGNEILMYFYKGSFDHRFNVVAIGKDLGIHDGRSLTYQVGDETKEFKARGFNEFYSKIPDEAVAWIETKLLDKYTKQVMEYISVEETLIEEGDEDGAL